MAAFALADTHTASSCSSADIQTAVSAASAGDFVEIPACSCGAASFTGPVTTSLDDLTIYGQGQANTCLEKTNDDDVEMFEITGGAANFEWYGITLQGPDCSAGGQVEDQHALELLGSVTGFNIHDSTFRCVGDGVYINGNGTVVEGVIYDNTFELISAAGGGYGVGVDGASDDAAWIPGMTTAVYIEDNYFTQYRHCVASIDSSRYVFRFNECYDVEETHNPDVQDIDAHGLTSDPDGSCCFEIYETYVHESVSQGWAGINIRGGDGVIFNMIVEDRPDKIVLDQDQGCSEGGYPYPDQTLELYVFNMTGDGDDIRDECTSVHPDQDYWAEDPSFDGTSGIGVGTAASMPSTCTPGVAYWATDEGEWNSLQAGPDGRLYKCTSMDTWEVYYTPYTYPHPARASGGSGVVDTESPIFDGLIVR